MLLLDTDSKDLAAMIFKRGDGSIPAQNTLAIPLRAPKDYRADSKRFLEWLSRRWLYNIPRSLQTEGLRPFGRLAFVDHCPKILDRLCSALQTATSEEAVDRSRQTTGLEFAGESPNVFVVASLAGGTGSGVALDLGYAVRKVLGELQLPDQRVFGVLTHSTSRKAASRDLAIANTLAALQELRHFGGASRLFSLAIPPAICRRSMKTTPRSMRPTSSTSATSWVTASSSRPPIGWPSTCTKTRSRRAPSFSTSRAASRGTERTRIRSRPIGCAPSGSRFSTRRTSSRNKTDGLHAPSGESAQDTQTDVEDTQRLTARRHRWPTNAAALPPSSSPAEAPGGRWFSLLPK